MPSFYEFFAGGGLARAGLGPGWTCLFANDIDPKKADTYQRNWGDGEIRVGDVALLSPGDLPGGHADLAWASFPCQDLSLAGVGEGLRGARSGTFWPFWRLMKTLRREGRAPTVIVLENVCGALTSHGGADFRSLIEAFRTENYRCGAFVLDAALFLPQSRPRLFVVGVRAGIGIHPALLAQEPAEPFHNTAIRNAHASLRRPERKAWLWWRIPPPQRSRADLTDILEDDPPGVEWHLAAQTARLLEMMSPAHLAKVGEAGRTGRRIAGALYKRTRRGERGAREQRAEVRFDGLAGCLRTPSGGSSRQTILVVDGSSVRSRLLSARETARLMGLPDSYQLPDHYNEAYHLTGDGVAVPIVRHLAEYLLEPLLTHAGARGESAA